MLDIARLEIDRQINVGNALSAIMAPANWPTPLSATTAARGDAVIAATLGLVAAKETPPAQVDHATDSVVTAFDRCTAEMERTLRDSVVPLQAPQQAMLANARLVRTQAFGQGTDYIRLPMDLQWRHLCELRTKLQDPAVAAAIDALGLRPLADHVLAHIERYGKVLGQQGAPAGRNAESASVAWHEAFKRFASQVSLDYENDEATRQKLLAPYATQLDQQRAVARAELRARRNNAEATEPAPPSGQASAPA